MSGTSLDGIDVAIANISGVDESTKVNFIEGVTIPWSEDTYLKIKQIISKEKITIDLISQLNYKISYEYYEAIKLLCKKTKINIEEIDFVSIHGQTVWHDPKNNETPSTLQLGSGAVLSALLKTTVISNFRLKDIVLGGEGAPLVPVFDKLIFSSKNKQIAAHNLGGISNLTLLKNKEIVLAFDTGPSNMMIDYFTKELFDLPYDNNGDIAQTGKCIKEMYKEVMSLNYFKLKPPKSTGRELFGDHYCKYLMNKYKGYNKEDYIKTASDITIDSIVNSYKYLEDKYGKIDEIIFSGGGAHNKYIIHEIKRKLANIDVTYSSKYNVDIDFKEAIAFIILGNQTYKLRKTSLAQATGSKESVILGDISYY